MTLSTDVPISLGSFAAGDPISRRQGARREIKPVIRQISGTTVIRLDMSDDTALGKSETLGRKFDAPVASAAVPREVVADSTPLQIWEGTVLKVDHNAGIMQVLLDAKIGQMPRHTGEIGLDDVSAQDQDLVHPGAVFYLTLYKRSIPSTENVEELRFRRRPSWSEAQLKQIEEDAATLLSKMKTLPTAT